MSVEAVCDLPETLWFEKRKTNIAQAHDAFGHLVLLDYNIRQGRFTNTSLRIIMCKYIVYFPHRRCVRTLYAPCTLYVYAIGLLPSVTTAGFFPLDLRFFRLVWVSVFFCGEIWVFVTRQLFFNFRYHIIHNINSIELKKHLWWYFINNKQVGLVFFIRQKCKTDLNLGFLFFIIIHAIP